MTNSLKTTMLATTGIFMASTFFAGMPTPALGQQLALEEIIVTGRKREESLMEIPVAITAFTAADIERQALYDVGDITYFTPGMEYQSNGGNGGGGRYNPNLFFRGMFNSLPLPRQSVGSAFIDGVYVLGGLASVNTVDVERVEIIKGPQNAYFGRNTFGGAINFITKNPGQEFAGSVSASGSTRSSHNVSASFEGPLVEDKLSFRVSGQMHQKGAHYTATDGGALGQETTDSITATLYATPNENTWIRGRVHYQEDEDGPPSWAYLRGSVFTDGSCANSTRQGVDLDGNSITLTGTGLDYWCGTLPSLGDVGEGVVTSNTSLSSPILASAGNPNGLVDVLVNNSLGVDILDDAPSLDHFGMRRQQLRLTLSAEHEFGNGITLAGNFGYNKNDTNAITDPDISDNENVYNAGPAIYEDISAEIRLSSPQDDRLRWLIGANYYEGKFTALFNGSVGFLIAPFFGGPIDSNPQISQPVNRDGEDADVLAAFAAIEYDITDQLSINLEGRYQEDNTVLQQNDPNSQQASFSDFLPRVILTYKPSDNLTAYASYAKGVLPGQFNSQYINATPFQRGQIEAEFPGISDLIPSEKVDSYEIGIKQEAFDGRLRYTMAAYLMDWTNKKVSAVFTSPTSETDPSPTNFGGLIIPGNSQLWGVEFESTYLITEKWDANLRVNWQDSEYKFFINPFLGDLAGTVRFDGNQEPRTPTWSGSLSSTYRDQLNTSWDWYLRTDVIYRGSSWLSQANIAKSNAFFRANARVGFESDDLLVELYVTNLFNDKNWDTAQLSASLAEEGAFFFPTASGGFSFRQGAIVQAPDKREVGLRMRYNF